MTTPERMLIVKLAAHTRWAKDNDHAAALAPARKGMEAKWAREADPDGLLTPAELEKKIASLRKVHMTRMALRSVQARAARKGRAA